MRKTISLSLLAAFVVVASVSQSCKKEEETPKPEEFIASDASFANFMTWTLEASHNGPDPALGTAHGGNDSTVTRDVYFKDGQDRLSGSFPTGTIVVKRSHNGSGMNEVTAMTKRGNNFNPNIGNWEFFMLNPDGTIAVDSGTNMPMRGANLMGGMCGGCHSQAASQDFIFSK